MRGGVAPDLAIADALISTVSWGCTLLVENPGIALVTSPQGGLAAGHHALSLLENGWVGEEHLPHLRKQWVLQERGGGGRVLLELLHRAHRVVQQRRVAGRPLPGKSNVFLNPAQITSFVCALAPPPPPRQNTHTGLVYVTPS